MKLRVLSAAISLTLLSACNTTSTNTVPVQAAINVEQILNSQNSWNFELSTEKFLTKATQRITQLASQQQTSSELDQLLYYLRGFSYYADTKEISKQAWQGLEVALSALESSNLLNLDSPENARLIEQYAVTLYRFYDQEALSPDAAKHIEKLSQLVTLPYNLAVDADAYAHWEVLRSMAFLTFEAKNNQVLAKHITNNKNWLNSLKTVATKTQDWQREHAVWALAYQHKIFDEAQLKQLDDDVWQIISQSELSLEQQKFIFSERYLVNSFRGLSECKESFKGKCSAPTIDTALPINHKCSDSLFIRATEMNAQQLQSSCKKLTSQESSFHELLATQHQPAANDHNDSLRVVIFDNYSQYNQYGQMVFDIHTDNGGMYIEGTPSDPDNQATFFSYEVFWQRPEFKVWNLNHEYVHYLDGRFSKYGSFGHFPSHLVWWSEGLAELIAKSDTNPDAYKEARKTAKDEWPTLDQIFATTYQDGSVRVYKWSYMAIYYMSQVDREGVQLLSKHLKNDFFAGYKSQLDSLAKKHQAGFEAFLQQQLANNADKTVEKTQVKKPQQLYRYLYRDYLMPKQLKLTQQHKHIL